MIALRLLRAGIIKNTLNTQRSWAPLLVCCARGWARRWNADTLIFFRFYRTPEEIDADNAAAAKLERAAARHRSAIRRSPIVRGGRNPTLGSDSTAFERQRAESTVQRVRERVQAFNDSREADAQIEVLEHELAVLRRERNRAVASRVNRRRAGDENRRILQEQIQRMTAHEFLRWQPPRGDSPSTLPSDFIRQDHD